LLFGERVSLFSKVGLVKVTGFHKVYTLKGNAYEAYNFRLAWNLSEEQNTLVLVVYVEDVPLDGGGVLHQGIACRAGVWLCPVHQKEG
jgi:hypothetical protein